MQSQTVGLVSLDKVRARYDIKAAILRVLETIPTGELMPEIELCMRAAGKDRYRFRRAVENNQELFGQRSIKLRLDEGDAKWFWGSEADIKAATAIRDE